MQGRIKKWTEASIPKIPSPASNHRKNWIFLDNQKMEPPNSMLPKVGKQVSLFRSCTLCIQGSAQKQDVAEPPCRPPSLTLPKVGKQVSLFRSCTLCIQGSAQKQDVAESPCRPPSLTLSVHGMREGPAPRAQVSLLWALLCPLPGVSDPLGGADALPCPSSLGDITVAALVKPKAKRPRAAAGQ